MKTIIKKTILRAVEKLGYTIKRSNLAETYFDIDPFFHKLYDHAQDATGMKSTDNLLRRQRHYVLNHLMRNCDLSGGDVCEAGCWRGLSAYQIATNLRDNRREPIFHIFDSFEGLSEIEAVDRYELEKRETETMRKQFACSMDEVKTNLKEFPFIRYYKGWIPERYAEVEDKKFSFVHIDVDLYQPILDSVQFFYPRMITGGLIIFDDYDCVQFPGAKKAVDEFMENKGDFFLPLPSGQAFLIKDPGHQVR